MPRARNAKIWNEELILALEARASQATQRNNIGRMDLWQKGAHAIRSVSNDIYVMGNGRIVNLPYPPKLTITVRNECEGIIRGEKELIPQESQSAKKKKKKKKNGSAQGGGGGGDMTADGNANTNVNRGYQHAYLNRMHYRGGGYALLLAMYHHPQTTRDFFYKNELIQLAQPYCDDAMEPNYFAGRTTTAGWKSMDSLKRHRLVHVTSHQQARAAGGFGSGGARDEFVLSVEGRRFVEEGLWVKFPESREPHGQSALAGAGGRSFSSSGGSSSWSASSGRAGGYVAAKKSLVRELSNELYSTATSSVPLLPKPSNKLAQKDQEEFHTWLQEHNIHTDNSGKITRISNSALQNNASRTKTFRVSKVRRVHLHHLCDYYQHPEVSQGKFRLHHESVGQGPNRALRITLVTDQDQGHSWNGNKDGFSSESDEEDTWESVAKMEPSMLTSSPSRDASIFAAVSASTTVTPEGYGFSNMKSPGRRLGGGEGSDVTSVVLRGTSNPALAAAEARMRQQKKFLGDKKTKKKTPPRLHGKNLVQESTTIATKTPKTKTVRAATASPEMIVLDSDDDDNVPTSLGHDSARGETHVPSYAGQNGHTAADVVDLSSLECTPGMSVEVSSKRKDALEQQDKRLAQSQKNHSETTNVSQINSPLQSCHDNMDPFSDTGMLLSPLPPSTTRLIVDIRECVTKRDPRQLMNTTRRYLQSFERNSPHKMQVERATINLADYVWQLPYSGCFSNCLVERKQINDLVSRSSAAGGVAHLNQLRRLRQVHANCHQGITGFLLLEGKLKQADRAVVLDPTEEEYGLYADSTEGVYQLVLQCFVHEWTSVQLIHSVDHEHTCRTLALMTVMVAEEGKMERACLENENRTASEACGCAIEPRMSRLEEFNEQMAKSRFSQQHEKFAKQVSGGVAHFLDARESSSKELLHVLGEAVASRFVCWDGLQKAFDLCGTERSADALLRPLWEYAVRRGSVVDWHRWSSAVYAASLRRGKEEKGLYKEIAKVHHETFDKSDAAKEGEDSPCSARWVQLRGPLTRLLPPGTASDDETVVVEEDGENSLDDEFSFGASTIDPSVVAAARKSFPEWVEARAFGRETLFSRTYRLAVVTGSKVVDYVYSVYDASLSDHEIASAARILLRDDLEIAFGKQDGHARAKNLFVVQGLHLECQRFCKKGVRPGRDGLVESAAVQDNKDYHTSGNNCTSLRNRLKNICDLLVLQFQRELSQRQGGHVLSLHERDAVDQLMRSLAVIVRDEALLFFDDGRRLSARLPESTPPRTASRQGCMVLDSASGPASKCYEEEELLELTTTAVTPPSAKRKRSPTMHMLSMSQSQVNKNTGNSPLSPPPLKERLTSRTTGNPKHSTTRKSSLCVCLDPKEVKDKDKEVVTVVVGDFNENVCSVSCGSEGLNGDSQKKCAATDEETIIDLSHL